MLKLNKPDLARLKAVLEKQYLFEIKGTKRLHGFYDANFKIKTSRGDYFVKIYGVDALPAILFQVDLIDTLWAAKLPVGKIIRTKDKKRHFGFAKTFGVVQEFVIGDHVGERPTNIPLLKNIGETLGKIHTITRSARLKGKRSKKYLWDLRQFHINVELLRKVKKHLPAEAYFLSKDLIDSWKKECHNFKKLRTGVIHNDFHGRNILVKGNKCTGILDFGDSLYSWFAADVAVSLMHLCFVKHSKVLQFSRAFLEGYFKRFDLTDAERRQLQLLIRMRACLVTVGMVHHFKGEPALFHKKFFKDAVYILKFFKNPKNQQSFATLYERL